MVRVHVPRAYASSVIHLLAATSLALTSAIAHADAPPTDVVASAAASIAVAGEDGKVVRFDQASLATLPQHSVRAEAHGKAVECTGANLIDVLGAVGAVSGEALRGKNLALYVRISAADGYRAVFALARTRSWIPHRRADRHGVVRRQGARRKGWSVPPGGAG